LTLDQHDPESFLDYKKYREIKKEYDEGATKEFYENLVENLDYDRYEGENVGFNERVYKSKLLNPLTTGPFRKTKRFMYRYSTLPDYDQIKDRRKTMKKQLYDKMKIGKHARKAKKSSDVSV
jgi:stress response protein YsnF